MRRRDERRRNRWYFGGLAGCMAVFFTHPFDLIKVLQQTHTDKSYLKQNIQTVLENNGPAGFYNGISASLLTQATYTTSRFAFYELGKKFFNTDTFLRKTLLALSSGALAGAVGVPLDVVNVRMQNDMKLPSGQRRNYKNVSHGLKSLYREGGVRLLFMGSTFARANKCLRNLGENAVYDEMKPIIKRTLSLKDGAFLHMSTSICSAIAATLLTQPIDVMKTRKMNAMWGEYSSNWDVVIKTAKEGPKTFYKGTLPSFLRSGPQTILTFLFMEQFRLRFGYLPKDAKPK